MSIRDLDLKNRSSWQGVLDMILALCDESADLSFDCRDIGGWKLPSAEFRLDAPAVLVLPQVQERDGYTVERWEHGTVILAKERPEDISEEGAVWLLRPDGAAAVTYRAFKEQLRVLQQLSIPAEFAWSSIPLAPICDDPVITAGKEQACYILGAIHTVWLRCSEDQVLQQQMAEVEPCGQLQVQNMATANTWIRGRLWETQLLEKLK